MAEHHVLIPQINTIIIAVHVTDEFPARYCTLSWFSLHINIFYHFIIAQFIHTMNRNTFIYSSLIGRSCLLIPLLSREVEMEKGTMKRKFIWELKCSTIHHSHHKSINTRKWNSRSSHLVSCFELLQNVLEPFFPRMDRITRFPCYWCSWTRWSSRVAHRWRKTDKRKSLSLLFLMNYWYRQKKTPIPQCIFRFCFVVTENAERAPRCSRRDSL